MSLFPIESSPSTARSSSFVSEEITNCVFRGSTSSKLIARPKGPATILLALFGLLGGTSTSFLTLTFLAGSVIGGSVVGASSASGYVVGVSFIGGGSVVGVSFAGAGSVVSASAESTVEPTRGSFSVLASRFPVMLCTSAFSLSAPLPH